MSWLPSILFFFFGAVAVGGALLAILRRDLVVNAMALVAMMLGLAGLFLLLDAAFLALVQVVVYAGAVMVLFLFTVMLMGQDARPRSRRRPGAVIGAAVLGLGFAAEGVLLLSRPVLPAAAGGTVTGGAAAVARLLFHDYLLPFELTALIILVAVVGVVALNGRARS